MWINNFLLLLWLLYKFIEKTLKFQFGEDFGESGCVGLLNLQRVEIEFYRNVGAYGSQELRHAYVVDSRLDLFAQLAFNLGSRGEHVVDAAEFAYELGGGLRTHAGASREVVGRIAHQRQEVDDLSRGVEFVLGAHLVGAHSFVSAAVTWPEYEHVVAHQLAIVLVGREHIGRDAGSSSLGCERTDDIVSLETVHLQHRDVHSLNDALYDRHRSAYVFGCLLALCLVRRECLVAKRLAMVERHTDMCGLLFGENLVESIDKSHHGRGVHALGIDARIFDERIICTVDERVSVEKK